MSETLAKNEPLDAENTADLNQTVEIPTVVDALDTALENPSSESEKSEIEEESSGSELGELWDSDSDAETNQKSSKSRTPFEKEGSDNEAAQESEDEIPHTANEILEEEVKSVDPGLELDQNTVIEKVGKIHSAGEKFCVIAADLPGDYRILKEGALLCLADKTPMGYLSEIFGPLEKPMLVVRFSTAEECSKFKSKLGESVFYVVADAQFELIAQFRQKGSDASNFNDEEVDADEMEYSDDDLELASKRASKKKRKTNNKRARNDEDQQSAQETQNRNFESTLVFSQLQNRVPRPSSNTPIVARVSPKDQLLARLRAQLKAKNVDSESQGDK